MQRISIKFDPPTQGQPLRICYDFSGLNADINGVIVSFKIDSKPPSTGQMVLTRAYPCEVIGTPNDAKTVKIHDTYGLSPDLTATFVPVIVAGQVPGAR